ncbi:MAG: hypothetical protein U9R32_04915, partial [Bacteroidota bacterium]|nr:hypothetical protein [Bacteroidota bacterium]
MEVTYDIKTNYKHMKIRFSVIIIASLILSTITKNGFSQTFDDIKNQYQDTFNKFKEENEKKFNTYVKQIDQEFADYLKDSWEKFSMMEGTKLMAKPKPKTIPEYNSSIPPKAPTVIKVSSTNSIKQVIRQPKLPNVKKTESDNFAVYNGKINFYGKHINFKYDQQIKKTFKTTFSEEDISKYWVQQSKTNYNHLIDFLSSFKNEMNLNDWGYYLLTKQVSENIFPKSTNDSRLLTWFLLTRSRYKTKIAFSDNTIFLMLPSLNTLYNVNYYSFNGLNYYLLDTKEKNVQTFRKDFPEADIVMDLNIYSPINTSDKIKQKKITFKYKNKTYPLTFSYNENSIKFYKDYPLTDIDVYFNSAVSRETKESIIENLKPLVKDKSEIEATNFLLNFVQTAFEYKTDQEYLGREKFYFPEEIFFYKYSDCEDRSILFSYLVKQLLKLDIVGLEYKKHIATAVNFNTNVVGDFLTFKNKKFTVADPTYINAPVGLSMPNQSSSPKIIQLAERRQNSSIKQKIRSIASKAGAFRGDNKQDLIFDSNGNSYLTGYFINEVKFNGHPLKSNSDSKAIFIAKFDKNGKIIWAKKAVGSNDNIGCRIILDKNEEPYISGTINGSVLFENTKLTASENSDIFLAKYNKSGNLLWANKLGIDKVDHNVDFMFMTKYDKQGNKKMARLYNETENFDHYGLSIDSLENIYITGSFYASTGINVTSQSYMSSNSFNPVSSLKTRNDELIRKEYENTIAGLFAIFDLLTVNTTLIPGKSAQQAFDKYNQNFKNYAKEIYKNIGNLSFF